MANEKSTITSMNIYQKLNEARYALKQKTLKGSGKNDYAGFTYIQLDDILPEITKLEHTFGYMTLITFTNECATARVVNLDKTDESIVFTSPMSTASLKGCHEVQNLGAVETYLRRYLYMTIYEIVEQDVLDKTAGEGENKGKKAVEQKQASTTSVAKDNAKETAINTVMPMGKYQGYKLGEINPDYLNWYLNKDGGDAKLKTAIEIVLKVRGYGQKAEPKAEAPKAEAPKAEPKKEETKGKAEFKEVELTQDEIDDLPFTV